MYVCEIYKRGVASVAIWRQVRRRAGVRFSGGMVERSQVMRSWRRWAVMTEGGGTRMWL